MIRLSQCAASSGLGSEELVIGVTPSKLHDRILEACLQDEHRNYGAICEEIATRIRAALDFGEHRVAADLLIVLRRMLAERLMSDEQARRPDIRTPPAQIASRTKLQLL
jgi:hypothetical protein